MRLVAVSEGLVFCMLEVGMGVHCMRYPDQHGLPGIAPCAPPSLRRILGHRAVPPTAKPWGCAFHLLCLPPSSTNTLWAGYGAAPAQFLIARLGRATPAMEKTPGGAGAILVPPLSQHLGPVPPCPALFTLLLVSACEMVQKIAQLLLFQIML